MKTPFVRISALLLASSLLFALSVLALSGQVDSFLPSILTDNEPSVKSESASFTVILDAGHGGPDGGATGIGGVLEKNLNLAVTQKAGRLLEECGFTVLYTRTDDVMLGSGSSGHKKLEDLRARLDYANGHPDAILVSVHMNKFPLSYCRGVQLYRAKSEGSEALGESFLGMLRTCFQPDNKRELKTADSAIYLLDRVRIPAVLIECGFLSNEEEATLLQSEDYQQKLAALITASVAAYRERKNEEKG